MPMRQTTEGCPPSSERVVRVARLEPHRTQDRGREGYLFSSRLPAPLRAREDVSSTPHVATTWAADTLRTPSSPSTLAAATADTAGLAHHRPSPLLCRRRAAGRSPREGLSSTPAVCGRWDWRLWEATVAVWREEEGVGGEVEWGMDRAKAVPRH